MMHYTREEWNGPACLRWPPSLAGPEKAGDVRIEYRQGEDAAKLGADYKTRKSRLGSILIAHVEEGGFALLHVKYVEQGSGLALECVAWGYLSIPTNGQRH